MQKPKDQLLHELSDLAGSEAKAEAILKEIEYTENISDPFIEEISKFYNSGISAEYSGLGCRGEGDFFIHHKIAELISNKSMVVGPDQQDDAGVIQVGEHFISVAVDGMHSRLSQFPFLAGFHVARAAIRDIIVMGCTPKAIFSDIHLANDGDVAKVFDYTSGIATVSELTEIPLVAGSTLRIGGDLVLGDRLTGCAGCVGYGRRLTPRKSSKPGDILIMTEGSGGGTIATTALYNGYSEVAENTLSLRIINLGKKLIDTDIIKYVHAITDVTNGGIRGDLFEIANTAQVRITLFKDRFRSLINPKILDMLTKLDIDPMGVSIDSLLIILPRNHAGEVIDFIRSQGYRAEIVGVVQDPFANGSGVQIIKEVGNKDIDSIISLIRNGEIEISEITPEYREAPYTPIKKVVNISIKEPSQSDLEHSVEVAVKKSLDKKLFIKDWLIKNGRL